MPSYQSIALAVWASLLTLLIIALGGVEVIRRRTAGPVRFRLPMASPATRPRGVSINAYLMLACVFLFLLAFISGSDPTGWVLPVFWLWFVMNYLQSTSPRRHTMRWRVFASGVVALAVGAMMLSLGFRDRQPGESLAGMPPWFFAFWSLCVAVPGVTAIREFLTGTMVREGGIELFGGLRPWSTIVAKGWDEREDGPVLRVSFRPSRARKPPGGLEREIAIPVPAAVRPELEDFLAARLATLP